MKLNELNELIVIRNYVCNSTGNGAIDKTTINYLNNLLLLIDKKIIELLSSEDFKEYIHYGDLQEAIAKVRKITNIKSGIKI